MGWAGVRLFVALELPEAVRAELARAQAGLQGCGLRLADVAGLHLTLQFLGDADESLVGPLLSALGAVAAGPITLRLAGLGGFPSSRLPKVAWVGVDGDLARLGALQAAVLGATAPLGFAAEQRAFTPHLTLGRARKDAGPGELRAIGAALARAPAPAPIVWAAGRPTLYQSVLTPRGAVYTALGP